MTTANNAIAAAQKDVQDRLAAEQGAADNSDLGHAAQLALADMDALYT